jgi:hypothetical protein
MFTWRRVQLQEPAAGQPFGFAVRPRTGSRGMSPHRFSRRAHSHERSRETLAFVRGLVGCDARNVASRQGARTSPRTSISLGGGVGVAAVWLGNTKSWRRQRVFHVKHWLPPGSTVNVPSTLRCDKGSIASHQVQFDGWWRARCGGCPVDKTKSWRGTRVSRETFASPGAY